MGQSKLISFIETLINVLLGLVLSIFIVQPIVFSYWDIHLNVGENTIIAIIFTTISVIRGYITRRIFNWWHHKHI